MRRINSISSTTPTRRSLGAPATTPARAGVIIILFGVAVAALVWTGVIGGAARPIDTSSPSYVDGSAYANSNFSSTSSEASVCSRTNANPLDNLSLWTRGCQDAWSVAMFSIGYPNQGGYLP